jgi:hypothetical protein
VSEREERERSPPSASLAVSGAPSNSPPWIPRAEVSAPLPSPLPVPIYAFPSRRFLPPLAPAFSLGGFPAPIRAIGGFVGLLLPPHAASGDCAPWCGRDSRVVPSASRFRGGWDWVGVVAFAAAAAAGCFRVPWRGVRLVAANPEI